MSRRSQPLELLMANRRRWRRLLLGMALVIVLPFLLIRVPVGGSVELVGEIRYQMPDPGPAPGQLARTPIESVFGNRGLYLVNGPSGYTMESGPRLYVSEADWARCWPEQPHDMQKKGYTIEAVIAARPLLLGGHTPARLVSVRRIAKLPVITK